MYLLFGRFPAKMGGLEPLIFRDRDIQFFFGDGLLNGS